MRDKNEKKIIMILKKNEAKIVRLLLDSDLDGSMSATITKINYCVQKVEPLMA